jgi:hypothetical protein
MKAREMLGSRQSEGALSSGDRSSSNWGRGKELAKVTRTIVPAIGDGQGLPALWSVPGAAAFVWEKYFKARHHNRNTQRAYLLAVRRFLA